MLAPLFRPYIVIVSHLDLDIWVRENVPLLYFWKAFCDFGLLYRASNQYIIQQI